MGGAYVGVITGTFRFKKIQGKYFFWIIFDNLIKKRDTNNTKAKPLKKKVKIEFYRMIGSYDVRRTAGTVSPAELSGVVQHGSGMGQCHPVQSQRTWGGRRRGVEERQGPLVIFVVLRGEERDNPVISLGVQRM